MTKDPLEGYRGYENVGNDIKEILIAAGRNGTEHVFEAAKELNDAQHISQFLKGPAGKLLISRVDGVLVPLLEALTATDYNHWEVATLCENYRAQALSLAILLQTVQEAGELQDQLEQEQFDDQLAADVAEPFTDVGGQ